MKLPSIFSKGKSILQGDLGIWTVFFLLGTISIIEVYSASSNMSYQTGAFWRPVMEHTGYFFIGFIFTLIVHKIPCRYFKLIPLAAIPLSLLFLILTLFAEKVNNASRWYGIGGVSFQPSEVAKWSLVVYIALILSNMQTEKGASKQAFGFILWPAALFCALIFPENFSTAAMTFLITIIMMFIGRIPWKQLGKLLGLITLVGASAFCFLKYTPADQIEALSKQKGLHRLETWANRLKDHSEETVDAKTYNIRENTQVAHARIAIASSNILGKGPGNSVERDFLPQPFSDFIYAIIVEETGLLGGAVVMFLYFILLFRTSLIASRCERSFPAFLIMGLAIMMVIQAMINMAVAVGVFPVTGQPLPLVSKGGTSTIMNCIYIGMILSVSRSSKKRPEFTDVEREQTV